jgi:hypothetical protein
MKTASRILIVLFVLASLFMTVLPSGVVYAWDGGVKTKEDCQKVTVTAKPEDPYWTDHNGKTQIKWVVSKVTGEGEYPWVSGAASGVIKVEWTEYKSDNWGITWSPTGSPPHKENYPWSAHKPKNCKIKICHATGSDTNPYVEQTVADDGVYEGHADHEGDIIPAPAEGCPKPPPTNTPTPVPPTATNTPVPPTATPEPGWYCVNGESIQYDWDEVPEGADSGRCPDPTATNTPVPSTATLVPTLTPLPPEPDHLSCNEVVGPDGQLLPKAYNGNGGYKTVVQAWIDNQKLVQDPATGKWSCVPVNHPVTGISWIDWLINLFLGK